MLGTRFRYYWQNKKTKELRVETFTLEQIEKYAIKHDNPLSDAYKEEGYKLIHKAPFIEKTDKNGVDMCESDIVMCADGINRVIEWHVEDCGFVARHLPDEEYDDPIFMSEDTFEVVGNRFEWRKK